MKKKKKKENGETEFNATAIFQEKKIKMKVFMAGLESGIYIHCVYKRKKAPFFPLIFRSPIILLPNHSLSTTAIGKKNIQIKSSSV